MIRADVLFDFDRLNALAEFYAAYPDLALDTVRDAFHRSVRAPFLDELRTTPPPAKHPFAFATPKSRRWYFYAIHAGLIRTSGGRYQRTGALAAGWRVDITLGDDAVVLSAANPVRSQKWVTGKRQVPGHRNTGWPLAKSTIDFWRDASAEVAENALTALLRS